MEALTDVAQVTPAWLTGILRDGGYLDHGHVTGIIPQATLPGGSRLVPLLIRYSPGAPPAAPARLIVKLARPAGNAPVPDEGRREVLFYRMVALAMPDPPFIRCFDAVYTGPGRYHLVLEDLSATHTGHPPDMIPPPLAHCEQIVDALARLHAFWWDHPQVRQEGGPLSATRTAHAELDWATRTFPAFADFLGDRLSPARRALFEQVLARGGPLLRGRLDGGRAQTLIHNDPHIGNFLYPRDPARDTLRIIDWKSWTISPGPADLAHMMAVFWFPERRARLEESLLRRYHTRLQEHGVAAYDWAACHADYRLAVVRLLLYPMWQWSTGQPSFIWWHHLERLALAYTDLGCAELLP